jgi:hypothetical protein
VDATRNPAAVKLEVPSSLRSGQCDRLRDRDPSVQKALGQVHSSLQTNDTARLLSVNVGLPRDIAWKGRMVRTGIWKDPARGRRRVGKLNLEGDGQGDLGGHGGEHRAIFVYQTDSYRYWQGKLGRSDLSMDNSARTSQWTACPMTASLSATAIELAAPYLRSRSRESPAIASAFGWMSPEWRRCSRPAADLDSTSGFLRKGRSALTMRS